MRRVHSTAISSDWGVGECGSASRSRIQPTQA